MLRAQLEEARRAGKRQAAPFSKGDPKEDPGRGGRRPGDRYGTRARRPVPDRVDEHIEVGLPDGCPCCGGELELEGHDVQYQEDIVQAPTLVRCYRTARGRCRRCGTRARGRHPGQTSDAVGAAGVMVGPRAIALAAHLNKESGMPAAKIARLLKDQFGLSVTAGGLYQALARLAARALPTYEALALAVRQSAAVAADETGWRVNGRRRWLWVFVGDQVTVYLIAAGRGYEQACVVLGADFAGVLERDGWAPYRRFVLAVHQTCCAHLLRRACELIADSVAGQARIPHAVKRLLKAALELRDEYTDVLAARDLAARAPHAMLPAPANVNAAIADGGGEVLDGEIVDADLVEAEAIDGEIVGTEVIDGELIDADEAGGADILDAEAGDGATTTRGDPDTDGENLDRAGTPDATAAVDTSSRAAREQAFAAARADLDTQLDTLLARAPTHAPNRKLLKHLATEREHLFTFLDCPGVQATNWRAEQALRPAVINRKQWGGNRSDHGAGTQQVLMSVIRTARQQGTCPITLLTDLQRPRHPHITPALRLPASAIDHARGP